VTEAVQWPLNRVSERNWGFLGQPPPSTLPSAGLELVLSLGAIHTPKVLMQSGIGDQVELQRFGIHSCAASSGRGAEFSRSL
jgi:choline dehydrogenase-like flavoprotein